MAEREERLTRELDSSHQHRALLYWAIYQEMSQELGAAKAEAILSRAIERRGQEAGAQLFGKLVAPTPGDVAKAFLAVSPAGGTLWPHDVKRHASGAVTINVHRCPLKEAWTEAGLDDKALATMCRIAGRFDNGCFGESGVAVDAKTWRPGHEGCCNLILGTP